MTIEERLESLERETGRLKRRNRWLVSAIILLAGGLIIPILFETTASRARAQSGGTAKEIRANSIVIEDEYKKTRATLCADKQGTSIKLFDENGKSRAFLAVLKSGPGLMLFDENGVARAGLVSFNEGPSLKLFDENEQTRAGLAALKDGPGLALLDGKGQTRNILSVLDSPNLKLIDKNGKVIWSAIK